MRTLTEYNIDVEDMSRAERTELARWIEGEDVDE